MESLADASAMSCLIVADNTTAYWIAFGPHGPRALPPPGEGWTVFTYTMAGLGVAFLLMWFARSMARPPPSTMTKEWQEQTNEYLKVFPPIIPIFASTTLIGLCTIRNKRPNQSPASHQKATRAMDRSRASQRSHSGSVHRASRACTRFLYLIRTRGGADEGDDVVETMEIPALGIGDVIPSVTLFTFALLRQENRTGFKFPSILPFDETSSRFWTCPSI